MTWMESQRFVPDTMLWGREAEPRQAGCPKRPGRGLPISSEGSGCPPAARKMSWGDFDTRP